jgi:uncharacterized protein (DUF2164 family)
MKKYYNKIEPTKEQKLQIARKLKRYLRKKTMTQILEFLNQNFS